MAAGDREGNIFDVKKAAALAPEYKQIILNAAHLLIYHRKCSDSLPILNNYIYKDSTDAKVFYWRSDARLCLDDLLGAYDDLYIASEIEPENTNDRAAQAAILPKLGDSGKGFENMLS